LVINQRLKIFNRILAFDKKTVVLWQKINAMKSNYLFFALLACLFMISCQQKSTEDNAQNNQNISKDSLDQNSKPIATPATKIRSENAVPDFSLPNLDGKQVALSDFEGKIVILDFWASWCKPCRMENPTLVNLYAKYKDKGLEIVSVSLDETETPWKQAIQKDNMTWVNVIDTKGDIGSLYNIEYIPATFVLDKKGVLLKDGLHGQELVGFIASQLD